MAGGDDSFNEETWDNSASVTLPETYPAMGPSSQNAKDWDICRLANCSAKRLRTIAKSYAGIGWRLNKAEMFTAICDAMNEEQECLTCEAGNCSPFTHWFAGTEPPPPGWVRGKEGMYVPPQPAENTLQGISPPGSIPADQVHAQQGTSSTGHFTNTQAQYTPQSLAGLDLATSNVRTRNPASHLLKPSGSSDLRMEAPTPYVDGVENARLPPPDVAALVKAGGSAIRTRSSVDGGVSTRPPPPVTEEPVDQDLENEIEQLG